MLISTGNLTSKSLEGQTAIITGAGRGIGYEAARALLWLGASVIIAEIDEGNGTSAARQLQREFGVDHAAFIQTDVGNVESVASLKSGALEKFGRVDIVINNATITPMGAVQDIPLEDWDASYRVNLRGPVLMARAFLPAMIERNAGVFVCISSVGQAYMGAYECFKAAQVHLADTLDAELQETGVYAFTIGPGLVRTPGAVAGIEALAPLYGKSVEEFFAMSEDQILSAEAAGAAYAAAVVNAEKFRGQEIGSRQALIEAGITLEGASSSTIQHREQDRQRAIELIRSIHTTLAEQADGWRERPLFERQWMFRDFKKNAGMPVEGWLKALEHSESRLAAEDQPGNQTAVPLQQLADYYENMKKLARGYEKDPKKLEDNLVVIDEWRNEVQNLISLIKA
ncbi:MAG: SDR family oxidoreductase [Anaerolineales bacterium]|nr:SDR family oxidoreductase [Anaerolineales bacterium]